MTKYTVGAEFQRHQNAYDRVRQDVQLSDDNWNLAPLPRNSAGENATELLFIINVKKEMKQQEKQKYSRKFTIRFTEKEFELITGKFKYTTCRKLSDYLRIMIMSKPLKVTYRNQSADEFLAGMIALKNELNAIGNNFNQAVKHLYSLSETEELKTWLLLNESTKQAFMSKVEEIKLRMQQLYELWSQK